MKIAIKTLQDYLLVCDAEYNPHVCRDTSGSINWSKSNATSGKASFLRVYFWYCNRKHALPR